jgi:pyrophosphatase PpaX
MAIKAVLFDWDGVLVDSRFVGYACSSKIFEAYGLKSPPIEIYLAEVGSDYVAYYQKYGLSKTVTEQDMNKIWDAHFHFLTTEEEREIPLRSGVAETFRELRARSIKIGIVSSNTTMVIERTTARYEIRKLIDEVYADISGSKAEALKRAVQKLGSSPAETFFVEDSPQVIPAARLAGVIPVAITGGFGTEEALRGASPDYVIHEIPDLLLLLQARD